MKDSTFKVGEIAILQNIPSPFDRLNGEECEVLETLAEREVFDLRRTKLRLPTYIINMRGMPVAVEPRNLKKKYPPAKTNDADFGKVVEWDDCAWTPTHQAA